MSYPLFGLPQELETILLVEDEPLVRIGLTEFLRERGYRVLEASDAREALAALNSGPVVDLVIADVRLPGEMDGFELGRRLKENWPDISFVATSGVVSPTRDEIGGPLLVKPYTREALLSRVEAALRNGKSRIDPKAPAA